MVTFTKKIELSSQNKILRGLFQVHECYTTKFCKEEEDKFGEDVIILVNIRNMNYLKTIHKLFSNKKQV